MNILVPQTDKESPIRRYAVAIPDVIAPVPDHFPEGFPADYPAAVTDAFARDILELSETVQDTFHVFIDLQEFLNTEYPWMPFTLALHAVILAPQCNVFFRGTDPVRYSMQIDAQRPRQPLCCIQNFVAYLCTKTGDRPRRVFEQVPSGSFVSFEYRIMDSIGMTGGFHPYYRSWLLYPYEIRVGSEISFKTHPFDHLPVKNLSGELAAFYFTKAQLKKIGEKNPDIDKAVFLHDQIGTVTLRPYWKIS